MKIRHQYNSATPYESCGYERIPAYPQLGDDIQILCRTEPYHSTARLSLCWNKDGVAQEAIPANFCRVDCENRGYYSFSLPKLSHYHNLSYYIETMFSSEHIRTENFYLTPLCKQKPKEIQLFKNEENGILLSFRLAQSSYFWYGSLQENEIHMRLLTAKPPSNDKWTKLPENYCFTFPDGIQCVLQLHPFTLSLSNAHENLWLLRGDDVTFLTDESGKIHKIDLSALIGGSAFYGLGERFNSVNQMNQKVLIHSYEKFTQQGNKSYLPIPFFSSNRGYGFFHQSTLESDYTFTPLAKDETAKLSLSLLCNDDSLISEDYLFLGTVSQMIEQYILLTGKAVLPPKWAFGPWMSSNRWENQAQVEEQLDAMARHQIPANVIVIERWSDDTTFDCFEEVPHPVLEGESSFLRKDFRFSESKRWPDPFGLVHRIHEMGLHLILWQAPIIRKPSEGTYPQCEKDYAYAIKQKYCVMMPDGSPFLCPEGWFHNSLLLDFTNENAVAWWMKKREWLLDELQIDGFKTDSGELVTDDRCLFHNGKNGREMRNTYPMYYEKAYSEFLSGHGVEGINFTRAGYSGAQQYPIHWTGDQKSTFEELRAQLVASLSAGLSGVLFVGTDLAGFAGAFPTRELYLRSISFAAFSGLMQFHSEPTTPTVNNDRSPWNLAEVLQEPSLLEQYRRYANLRMKLIPYLYNEGRYCVEFGRPLMAHLIFDYPNDPQVKSIESSYLLGRSLLVAPVMEKGVIGREIYFPDGEWLDLFKGDIYVSGNHFYPCGETEIPVFLKKTAFLPLQLCETVLPTEFSLLNEEGFPYEPNAIKHPSATLSLLTFGEGNYNYQESASDFFSISVKESCITVTSSPHIGSLALFSLENISFRGVIVNGHEVHFERISLCIGNRIVYGVRFLR